MKNKLLATALLAAVTFYSASASAYYAGVIITPVVPVVPAPVANPCEVEYNNIVQNEQTQLLLCNEQYQYDPTSNNICQQNVINETNAELYNNLACRDYYVQFGVVFIPGHEHRDWRRHPEHFPNHHDRREYRR